MQNVIYKLTSPSGKVYIGQAKCFKKRMNEYRDHKGGSQPKLKHAIKKHGWQSFTKEVIDQYHGNEVKDGLNALETYYITHFNAVDDGYNCCRVGGSTRGTKRSPEFCKAISERFKGKKLPPERVEQIRLAGIGRKQKKESIEKTAKANRERIRGEEERKNMGTAQKIRFSSREEREKMSKKLLGRKDSDEVKERKRIGHIGLKHPDSVKQKMSEARKAYWARRRQKQELAIIPS